MSLWKLDLVKKKLLSRKDACDEHPSTLDDSDPDCEVGEDVESDVFNSSIQLHETSF